MKISGQSTKACRWIIPYSEQFKFVFLATGPFTPRWLACWLVNSWMTKLYKKCGMSHIAPAYGSSHNFTGQCNDAFFQLAKQVSMTAAESILCDWDDHEAKPQPDVKGEGWRSHGLNQAVWCCVLVAAMR